MEDCSISDNVKTIVEVGDVGISAVWQTTDGFFTAFTAFIANLES
jgi:hypothetical protein